MKRVLKIVWMAKKKKIWVLAIFKKTVTLNDFFRQNKFITVHI